MLCLILIVLVVNSALFSISINNKTNNIDDDEKEEIPVYDVSNYNRVNCDEFKKLTTLKGAHVIYIGKSSCGCCTMFIPILNDA